MGAKYENDFKAMIVGLLQSGRSVKEVSLEYDLNDSMIRRWRREFEENDGFSKPNVPSDQEQELKSLRKELKEVQLERDILKKAVSIFSKSDR